MECPACPGNLTEKRVGNFELDACVEGCGGVWFDAGELDKFDEKHEFPYSEILTLAKEKEAVRVELNKKKMCPRCDEERLVRQFIDPKNEVEIDQCWGCGGIWFDLGEINTVRAQYETIEDRSSAVNGYLDSHLENVENSMSAEVKEQVERYNEATKTRFGAAKHAFMQLLGLDDPGDNL